MRMRKILLCLCILQLSLTSGTAEPWKTMKLWPGKAPGEKGDIGPESERPPRPGQRKVVRNRNVSTAKLSVYRPQHTKGPAEVNSPGGGY